MSEKKNNSSQADQSKDKALTREEFNKMGYQERAKLYQENRDIYDKLTK